MRRLKSEEKNSRKTVYIGIGTNLGKKKENIERTMKMLENLDEIEVTEVSPIYENEAYGNNKQPKFLNGVVRISTSLEPLVLLGKLKGVEESMGRVKGERWGPRIIDLDILFYDSLILRSKELTIPHADLHNRWFEHPVKRKTIKQLFKELNGKI